MFQVKDGNKTMDSNLPKWLQELADNPDNVDSLSRLPEWLARLEVSDSPVSGIQEWMIAQLDAEENDK